MSNNYTQKELAYFEDAIGHESNIIKILQNLVNGIGDNKIVDFIKDETNKHSIRREKLLNFLKEQANE